MAITPTTIDPYYFDEASFGPLPATLSSDGLTVSIISTSQSFYAGSLDSAFPGRLRKS